MHNAAFAALDVAARYAALDVAPAALAEAFQRLRTSDVLGANVSVPHKQAAVRLVDEITPEAAALGAVNTVVNEGGRLLGSNTDVGGFLDGLLELAPELVAGGFRALVLGAGGAARAVIWGLVGLGGELVVVNRDPARAAGLVSRLEAAGLERGQARSATLAEIDFQALDLLGPRVPAGRDAVARRRGRVGVQAPERCGHAGRAGRARIRGLDRPAGSVSRHAWCRGGRTGKGLRGSRSRVGVSRRGGLVLSAPCA